MGASRRKPLNVAIVLYQNCEILDFAGPAEVFAAAAAQGADRGSEAFNVYTCASSREPIVSQGFIDVIPDYAFSEAPAPDIVVIPGGSSSEMLGDKKLMAFVDDGLHRASLTMTVCTGALAAGSLGALDGLTVTTHHGTLDRLAKMVPTAQVAANLRFVDNGRILTTAGVSAGIDGALHVVARLLGRKVADDTAWYMEYRWVPEQEHAASYSLLDPSRDELGRRTQQVEIDFGEGELSKAESGVRAMLAENDSDGYLWMLLTEVLRGQQRWSEALDAARQTQQLDGYMTEGLFLEAAAHARLGQADDAFAALDGAIENGFNQFWRLRQGSDFADLQTDPRFEALLAA